ncbi:hypothetical protein Dimus_034276 [Dionaea muscipula]
MKTPKSLRLKKPSLHPPLSPSSAAMATERLTEYERRRLENIRRNDEMMASLKIRSRLSELSSISKRHRVEKKTYKISPEKKPKTEVPIVLRSSLRCRGIPPDSSGLRLEASPGKVQYLDKPSARDLGPVSMRDAYMRNGSGEKLIELISSRSRALDSSIRREEEKENGCKDDRSSDPTAEADGSGSGLIPSGRGEDSLSCEYEYEGIRMKGSVDLESFSLESENIARVLRGKILSVRFFPTAEMTMIAAGNKFGDVAFWNVGTKDEDGDGIYPYHPHSEPVSGIVVPSFFLTKMYTSSYDGLVRMMDVEKEVFDLIYSGEDPIYSLSQPPNNMNSICFAEGGVLNMWDQRAGKASGSWALHQRRINSVDFNSANTNIMVTSSPEGTACVWDWRKMSAVKPEALMTVYHKRAVQSAYFSPSGTCLATTSLDNKVGVASGANFEDISMINHDNTTGRWISTFKAIWGWDDSYIYVGSMKRGVDVLSSTEERQIYTLQSPEISAISCRLDAHPCKIGMLASATSGGQIYIWTQL